jgi:CxxC motif-containing protein
MSSAKKVQVGGDIPYHCPKCDLKLSHTVLAMVGSEPARVKCNTCKSERNYSRARATGSGGVRTQGRKKVEVVSGSGPKPKHHSVDLYNEKLQASVMKTPKAFNINESFEEGDVIEHKKFGKGVVLKVIPPDRMEVIFRDETRALACKIK